MKTLLTVKGMDCQHCAAAVTKAVFDVEGVEKVVVDLDHDVVEIHHADNASIDAMKVAIDEQGYDVVD